MKIKSLLIGSAALMTVSTGSYAADAVVMAAPEPVEYVRVCDVYGAGFFYIPGTETCLKFGGYYRMQWGSTAGWAGYNNYSRFQLNVDARSETEWGTLRAYAELRADYGLGYNLAPAAAGYYGDRTYLNQGYIEVIGNSGTLRIGKSDTPYARFLGYGDATIAHDGNAYAFRNTHEISYTFRGGNGFSAIIALLDNANAAGSSVPVIPPASTTWATDIEGGVNFAQGWGSVGLILGYDSVNSTWGAKGALRFKAPNSGISAGLLVMYASGAGAYRVTNGPAPAAGLATWSAMGYVKGSFSPKIAAVLAAQWFDNAALADNWTVTGGLELTPVAGLQIAPEIRYNSAGAGAWDGMVRFQRNF